MLFHFCNVIFHHYKGGHCFKSWYAGISTWCRSAKPRIAQCLVSYDARCPSGWSSSLYSEYLSLLWNQLNTCACKRRRLQVRTSLCSSQERFRHRAQSRGVECGSGLATRCLTTPVLWAGTGRGYDHVRSLRPPISISERAWSREGKAILTTWVTQLLAAAQDWRKRWQTQVGIN